MDPWPTLQRSHAPTHHLLRPILILAMAYQPHLVINEVFPGRSDQLPHRNLQHFQGSLLSQRGVGQEQNKLGMGLARLWLAELFEKCAPYLVVYARIFRNLGWGLMDVLAKISRPNVDFYVKISVQVGNFDMINHI